jgi:hypothetical protein
MGISMNTSNEIDKITGALLAAQKVIGGVIKDKVGKIQTKSGGSYEYMYSNLASVLDEVKGPLNDNGILIVQAPSADTNGVTVTTRLIHESGQWIEEALYMPVSISTPQGFGSAITYCRRYSLQSIVGLKAEDDDGKEPKRKDAGAKQAAVDVFEAMAEDEQKFIQSIATQTIALFESEAGSDAAYAYVERQRLEQEEILALWSLLPSNVRSALKIAGKTHTKQ